jgi:hypothetical protein
MAKKEETQKLSNQFEFSKTKGFGAYNFVWINTMVTLNEENITVETQKRVLFSKKERKDVVVGSVIDKITAKTHFGLSDLIGAILLGVIGIVFSVATEAYSIVYPLLIVALLLLFAYGKNIEIAQKDGTKVVIEIGGPLSGGFGWKKEFEGLLSMVKAKYGK